MNALARYPFDQLAKDHFDYDCPPFQNLIIIQMSDRPFVISKIQQNIQTHTQICDSIFAQSIDVHDPLVHSYDERTFEWIFHFRMTLSA